MRFYLCPERRISFDGFVNYEDRRFGVPYSYPGGTARVERSGDTLYIYSTDLKLLLCTHDVTWNRRDSFCEGQYEALAQPEEISNVSRADTDSPVFYAPSVLSLLKFDFDRDELV